MALKVKFRTLFPALVTAVSPITLVKAGLSYVFSLDITALRQTLDPIYLVTTLTNIILSGSTSGTVTVKAPAVAGTNIVTVPAATDTLVGKATTDTLTNKTIDTAGPNTIKVGGVTVSAGQYPGTATNDSATAGNEGEYVSSTVLLGSAVSLVTSTAKDITSISLTAGDWDLWGVVSFTPAGTTTITAFVGWISTTSAVAPTVPNNGAYVSMQLTWPTGTAQTLPVGSVRLSLAATTTVYLSTLAVFGTSTMGAFGFIGARRRR